MNVTKYDGLIEDAISDVNRRAREIVAIPVMIDALYAASDFLADQVDVNWEGDGPNRAMQVKAEVDTAIARAEGRS